MPAGWAAESSYSVYVVDTGRVSKYKIGAPRLLRCRQRGEDFLRRMGEE